MGFKITSVFNKPTQDNRARENLPLLNRSNYNRICPARITGRRQRESGPSANLVMLASVTIRLRGGGGAAAIGGGHWRVANSIAVVVLKVITIKGCVSCVVQSAILLLKLASSILAA